MANIYLKQGAKYFVKFRVSSAGISNEKLLEGIGAYLTQKWDGQLHESEQANFPVSIRGQVDGYKTIWLYGKWKPESGTYCTDANMSLSFNDQKRGIWYQFKYVSHAEEPQVIEGSSGQQSSSWGVDLSGKEKGEDDHPSGTGQWPIGGDEKEKINIPGGKTIAPIKKTVDLSAGRRPGKVTDPSISLSPLAPTKEDSAKVEAETEKLPEIVERKPDPDAPPLGDEFSPEKVQWDESSRFDSSQMRNEPKPEEEKEEGNTALWLGLGAVGIGALVWWAATAKKK